MAEAVIETQGLRKVFKDVVAVEGLDLSLREGEIYGFLGPNGAGKTTTVKMILGLTFPTAGITRIRGLDVFEDPVEARTGIGYLPENVSFYDNLTARQTLEFFAEAKGAPREEVSPWLKRVGLEDAMDRKVGKFSKGMTQLLAVSQAFIGEPDLLILDEPTGGLDPRWTRTVRELIREVNDNGTTVFFSSHILSEVQELCDRVGILSAGRMVGEDSPRNLSDLLDVQPLLFIWLFEPNPKAKPIVEGVSGVTTVHMKGDFLRIECPEEARGEIVTALAREGIKVRDIRTEEPSLEEVFMKLTSEHGGRAE
jgi:ABC-2 type transport system ATP-binding protein